MKMNRRGSGSLSSTGVKLMAGTGVQLRAHLEELPELMPNISTTLYLPPLQTQGLL